MSKLAIKAENIGKMYRLGQVGTGTVSQDLNRWFAKIRGKEDPFGKIGETNDRTQKGTSNVVWALKDVSFEIEQGDAVGIIGRNGAGKSTLLKLLSKVTKPTTGSIKVKDRIASLLEVGTGFHPEMTGRENIFLNGAILGMTKKEITRKFDEIVDFSGVERYIDTPVKRYSSGMYVRLAFAVAAHLESEILIVDEVLAVGDAEFQKKCLGKMGDVSKGEGRTVLFVSHNIQSILELCNKGIFMANGQLKYQGDIHKTVNEYVNASVKSAYFERKETKEGEMFVREAMVLNEMQTQSASFTNEEFIYLKVIISVNEFVEGSSIFVTVYNNNELKVFSAETDLERNKYEYTLRIDKNLLAIGSYKFTILLHKVRFQLYDSVNDVCDFEVEDISSPMMKYGTFNHGIVLGGYKWL